MRHCTWILAAGAILGMLAKAHEPETAPASGGPTAPRARDYIEAVRVKLDKLLTHGTDRYGPVHAPMLMSVIGARTNEAPHVPDLLDAMVRTEERPGRRNPGGCDLWDDQPLLRTLYAMSKMTRDPRYERAADAYAKSFIERAAHRNGLFAWGSHLYYDAYTDTVADDHSGRVHEILILQPLWDRLWALDPPAVQREIEATWEWHIVDKATGQHNRHDDRQVGCDFAFSGGSFVLAFAFMHKATGDRVWLDRARLVADWHWRHRDPTTDLTVDAPSTKPRYDSTHCFTTIPGPHAAALLRAYEITRDRTLRDMATAYVRAYLKHGWDADAGTFYAALRPDGTPIRDTPQGTGYDRWMPSGHVDIWPTTMYSYEFPLMAAQTCTYAYEITKERAFLDGARKWASAIRRDMPPAIGRRWRADVAKLTPEAARTGGAYADGYGRAISFFVHLYHATKDPRDLADAVALADEAMAKLRLNGWFVGHPAKPYYEAVDGVGTLMYALLELGSVPRRMPHNL
ncbi:MAG: hypothetical protein FJX72_09975 [Armatimonadetes bacterium]|nr:hypothetical protein [Armatimonadota bacterium]